jgi:enterochelin esterase-like enzyme
MQRRFVVLVLILLGAATTVASAASAQTATRKPGDYPLTPDSLPQDGVPKGRLEGPFEFRSQIIANTVRRYWIYVPAQYTGETPANVLVFQDGARAINPTGALRVPQAIENLVFRKEIPVTIGVFITPGQRGDVFPDNVATGNPNNRAQEYDAVDDTYARFLIDELLPEIGRKYRLTADPARRAIGGTSSGAICAFTVAWHRPDAFRNVISGIGSYVSIGYRAATADQPAKSGGEIYPTWIRRMPIKPLRVFLQDGSNDLDNNWGNWFLANQQMLTAFEFANRTADTRKQGRATTSGTNGATARIPTRISARCCQRSCAGCLPTGCEIARPSLAERPREPAADHVRVRNRTDRGLTVYSRRRAQCGFEQCRVSSSSAPSSRPARRRITASRRISTRANRRTFRARSPSTRPATRTATSISPRPTRTAGRESTCASRTA